MIKITKRKATIEDFLKNKKHGEFAFCRDTAKIENFSLMFGAKPATFRNMLQYTSKFSVENCKNYIQLTHNESVYQDICNQISKGRFSRDYDFRTDVEAWYLAAATVMRDNFLKGYKGLADRIKREQKDAIKYCMSFNWYGGVRWYPELAYMGIDLLTLTPKGPNKKYASGTFNHIMNNAANTNIQSGETAPVYLTWITVQHYIDKWGLKSRIFNSIHDSLDFYIYKPEKELIKALANDVIHNVEFYPCFGIKHGLDFEVSDIRDYDHLKKHYYKHGEEEKSKSIEEALKEYNEANGTNLIYERPTRS